MGTPTRHLCMFIAIGVSFLIIPVLLLLQAFATQFTNEVVTVDVVGDLAAADAMDMALFDNADSLASIDAANQGLS